MDLYSNAEKLLNSYVEMKVEIENSRLEIQEIEADYDIKSIEIGEKSSKTNKISRELEDRIANKDNKIKHYQAIIKKNESILKKIENATKVLTELEKEVISLKYFHDPILSRRDISIKVRITTGAVDKVKVRSIKKMMKFLS